MDSAVDKFLDVTAQGKLHYIERMQMRCTLGLGSWYATDVELLLTQPPRVQQSMVLWACAMRCEGLTDNITVLHHFTAKKAIRGLLSTIIHCARQACVISS